MGCTLTISEIMPFISESKGIVHSICQIFNIINTVKLDVKNEINENTPLNNSTGDIENGNKNSSNQCNQLLQELKIIEKNQNGFQDLLTNKLNELIDNKVINILSTITKNQIEYQDILTNKLNEMNLIENNKTNKIYLDEIHNTLSELTTDIKIFSSQLSQISIQLNQNNVQCINDFNEMLNKKFNLESFDNVSSNIQELKSLLQIYVKTNQKKK